MSLTPEIIPLPLLRHAPSGFDQCVRLLFPPDERRKEEHCIVRVRRGTWESITDLGILPVTECTLPLYLPEVSRDVLTVFDVTFGDTHLQQSLVMGPARRWTVHLVLHSHTDLGFTHPISEVARIHNKNTDLAVQYCKDTIDWPAGSRFKWTCEVTWQLQNYLRDRTRKEVDDLMEWVRRGSIGVGALYSGELTGLLGHEEAVRCFAFAAKLRRAYAIPCDTALLSDVPGCTQGFVQVMAKSGIRNLIVADNNFVAPFLPRTDLPRPFRWLGEENTEVLTWYTDHPFYAYVEGEYYGFTDQIDTVEKVLPEKLLALESSGYSFDQFQIQYAFDNAPLSPRPMEIVKEWNSRWAYPRVVLSTAREFLEQMRSQYWQRIQARKGDWADWWSGIVTGFPHEESMTRRCHDRAPAVEFFSAQAALQDAAFVYPRDELSAVYDGLLAFDEHSGGGALWSPQNDEQQNQAVSEGYGTLYRATALMDSLEKSATGALARLIDNPDDDALLVVFNGSSHRVSGMVRLAGRGDTVLIDDIPPWGYKTCKYDAATQRDDPSETTWRAVPDEADGDIQNDLFHLRVSHAHGSCSSLFDKQLQRELVKKGQALNEAAVYVVHPRRKVELGKFIPEIYDGRAHPGEFLSLPEKSHVRITVRNDGLACQATHLIEGIPWLIQEYRLGDISGGVQMTNRIPRAVGDNADLRGLVQSFLSPKGHLYFRFAFDLPGGQFEYESTEMILRPAEAQFKGSCRDYFPIQKWCRITEGKGSLVLVLPDTPLVDVGSVGLMRFKEKLDQDQSTLLVRAVNLQEWGGTTASPYSKTEDLVVRCALRAFPAGREGVAHEESSARVNAHRFAVRAFPSLVAATVFPRQTGPLPSGEHEFCHCFPHSVEVMAMKLMEEGPSVLLRLRETTGFATQAMLSFPGLSLRRARRAMLTEEPLEDMAYRPEGLALHLAPFAIETLLLDLEMGHP